MITGPRLGRFQAAILMAQAARWRTARATDPAVVRLFWRDHKPICPSCNRVPKAISTVVRFIPNPEHGLPECWYAVCVRCVERATWKDIRALGAKVELMIAGAARRN